MSSASQTLLLTSLTSYYERNPNHRAILYDIVQGKSKLSLRILDWFVTHYARTNDILYWIDDAKNTFSEDFPTNSTLRKFNLYLKYRAELQSYTKMFFDPFRRHERITFILETTPVKAIETTIGQLNFFRWALHNHVLEYIELHLTDIEEHMASYQKDLAKIKGGAPGSVGAQTPSSALACVNKNRNLVMHAPCFIHFD